MQAFQVEQQASESAVAVAVAAAAAEAAAAAADAAALFPVNRLHSSEHLLPCGWTA